MKSDTIPALNYTAEETNFIQTTGTDLQNYVKDTQAKWLLEGGIENEWDAYLAKLRSLKLDEYLKVMQTAYDRFMK
jgi:putative aldouronate transport system substrate-binding protein